ncbi:hypothetical protein LNTAR_14962 [Lentisphaera araneosa HTCC2155]|uniref:AAA+ ATPase domain-containing protein n=1 Tax=Lentisphaera araneosa HTCC2155 TaxID=313628 RepID=A6DHP4_9BACT|nr:AAA family ATPase [Lentisphaera araneosa]EDM29127.1 hypothetical protein LNTAR_14962 [Lentisphaera araneosa HTCC2155]
MDQLKPILIDIFAELSKKVTENKLTPTGVDYIDKLLDGGLLEDDFVNFMGPSGYGKTTIMNQLLASYVEASRRALLISTEQSFKGDIASRWQTLMTGESKNAFLSGHVDERAQALLKTKITHWEKFAIFESWAKKEKLDLLLEIEQLIIQEQPEVVLFDGWQRAADLVTKGSKNSKLDLREALQGLKNLAIKHQIPIMITHQLNGVAASKGNVNAISQFDAQEDKDFVHRFDMSIVFSRTNIDGVTIMQTGKSRHSEPSQVEVRLNGEFCKFELVDEGQDSEEMNDFGSI